MKNEEIERIIEGIRGIREKSKIAAEEKLAAKIDIFDARSNLLNVDYLEHLAREQRGKEYEEWRKAQGLRGNSGIAEFERMFNEKVLAQSSLNVAPMKRSDVELKESGHAIGRVNADQLYWNERARLAELKAAREENERRDADNGYKVRKKRKVEGNTEYRLELILDKRALMIAYHEYLLKVRKEKMAAFMNLAFGSIFPRNKTRRVASPQDGKCDLKNFKI